MKILVTHEQPDFDALAALALAKLLVPDAVPVLQSGLPPRLQRFVNLYRDVVELVDLDAVELDDVTEMIVVDTAEPARIRPLDRLVGTVPITVFDHHPSDEGDLPAGRGLVERVGATATLLTRALEVQGREIPPPVATLGLLGIHEDTGHLTFRATGPEDHWAAAHLLRSGANLGIVRRFSRDVYDDDHRAFREAMIEAARETAVAGHSVVTAAFTYPTYVAGVSALANDLLDLTGCEAAVVAARMDDRTLVFARANGELDMGRALEDVLGGGGHPGAAFARTDLAPEVAVERVLEALGTTARRAATAASLMSRPVKTVAVDATVTEAQRLLARYGHNGLPVMDGDDVVGVVSRRDLERALRHGLGRSHVSGFMARNVITAGQSATLPELEAMVEEHNIGRIPIVEDGRLVGIVTRSDLLAARHATRAPRGPAQTVLDRLPRGVRDVLAVATDQVGDGALYLVGGTVRDALLGTGMTDLDLTVVGLAVESYGQRLQQRLGGAMSCHVAFGTCTLRLPSGMVVDVATAREETYRHPGALPDVTPSTLRKDLSRRDFTVNAVALRLHPSPPEIVDPFGGVRDIDRRILRILHPLSFVEDPTRLVRGARLAGRLSFGFEEETADRARAALVPEVTGGVSRTRLRAELELTLAETRVEPCLRHLSELGALRSLYGLPFPEERLRALDRLQAEGESVTVEAYLLALLLDLDERDRSARLETFHWPRRLLATLTQLDRLAESGVPREEALEALGEPGRAVLRVLGDDLAARVRSFEHAPDRRRLRGRDVIELGLPEGPQVGRVLEEVAEARAHGRVTSFEDEIELARRLIAERASGRSES